MKINAHVKRRLGKTKKQTALTGEPNSVSLFYKQM